MPIKSANVTLKTVQLTRKEFLSDTHARRYRDVVDDPRIDFDNWLTFFSDPLRQRRLLDAEEHHDRSALAGVVRELEKDPAFNIFTTQKRDDTRRHRQTIGVIVKLIMEGQGWRTTGTKGSLGNGRPGGVSLFFGRAERYKRVP
ncbi:MAG: hypothetical protein WCK05_11840 [Planctomycetota bacterium]